LTDPAQEQIKSERYTLRGNDELEARIASDMAQVVTRVRQSFDSDRLEAVVLIGGYGRGEGGALMEKGRVRPHNNCDLLVLIGKMPLSKRAACYAKAAAVGAELTDQLRLGVDLNVRPVSFLRNATHILINHDLRFGHRVLWGDPAIISQMPDYDPADVPMTEGSALLRNRGNCLLENRMALEKRMVGRDEERRKFIRHIFKATIGYGDAVLIAKGWYDPSYVAKLERITNLDIQEVPRADLLKAIYKEAAEFRFEPNYDKYMDRDYIDWLDSVLNVLEPIHVWFEKQRLGLEELNWRDHFDLVTVRGFDIHYGPLKRIRNLLVNVNEFGALKALGDFGWWYGRHPRDWMLAAFPSLMYRPKDWDYLTPVGTLLGVKGNWYKTAERYQYLYRKYLT
jgi:hypothetical protein